MIRPLQGRVSRWAVFKRIEEEKGEHVSGPAAAEYTARTGHVARFTGRAVTHARGVERLLAQTGPGVHHGQGMTCVWRAARTGPNRRGDTFGSIGYGME